jgi:hypothetical protein
MYLTSWLEGEGYFECFASFQSNTSPCLKVRIVKKSDQSYCPCIRSHPCGYLISEGNQSTNDIEIAKVLARELLIKLCEQSKTLY